MLEPSVPVAPLPSEIGLAGKAVRVQEVEVVAPQEGREQGVIPGAPLGHGELDLHPCGARLDGHDGPLVGPEELHPQLEGPAQQLLGIAAVAILDPEPPEVLDQLRGSRTG